MKKAILISVLFAAFNLTKSNAQVFSRQLAGLNGFYNIFYPYGYYQGQVVNGVANGTGTFYFKDGSFYYGNFYQGWWDGPGVVVSRRYGYVSGCFSRGQYMGICQNVFNPYNNNNAVQNVVTRVQDEKPNNNQYVAYDPDGYTITKVDANTEMGKTLLGSYKGK